MATRRTPTASAADAAARTLADLAPQAQALFDPQGRLVFGNAAWSARVDPAVTTLQALGAWLTAQPAGTMPKRVDRAVPAGGTAVFLDDAGTRPDAAAFLSRAAHQLRTPVASIYGFAELLAGRRMTPERMADAAQVVHRQSASLVRLIDLLLDLARLDARQGSDFRSAAVDPVELLREAVGELTPARVPGRVQLPDAAPAVLADRHWLRTALRELVDNACAYSGAATPVVVSAEPTEGSRLRLRIADRGAGLNGEELVRVFERFHRIGRPDDPPGHGLGLSLAHDIVTLHRGQLALVARSGGGVDALVELPLAPPAGGSPAVQSDT